MDRNIRDMPDDLMVRAFRQIPVRLTELDGLFRVQRLTAGAEEFLGDFEYFRRRVAQEDERARNVIGTEAELVHRALATLYASKALAALTGAASNDEPGAVLQSA